MVTVLPEDSLLLAARLLQTAADQAEDDTRTERATCIAEEDVKVRPATVISDGGPS